MKERLRERDKTRGKRVGLSPTVESSGSTDHERPVFTLHHLGSKDHCVSSCEAQEQAQVALALEKRAQFSWGQLRQMGRKELGYETISRDSLKAAVPSYFTDDETPISFRMANHGRIIGFRQDEVFHIVWIDVKFELYSH